MTTSQSPFLVCAIVLSFTINVAWGSGVLTIRLTGFKNSFGRTYDGACCDPTPKDHGSTCYDQCDYVMRLIVTGLGRANDHVFLFHRPLTYDSNNIVFTNGDSNLLLTVLFDEWPEDDQVKMNAFFYDYDDFDHTTTLVDWFETDLRHSTNSSTEAAETWGNFQQQTVVGNRQTDKTILTFEWSALRHKSDEYTTIPDNKFTFTTQAKSTQMLHLSTSMDKTHILRQSWNKSQDYSSVDMNFKHDLEKTIPVLIKSAVKRQKIRDRLGKQETQKAESNTKNHTSSLHLVRDMSNSKRDEMSSFNHNDNARRKSELLKGKRTNISKAHLRKRRPTTPRSINNNTQNSNNHELNLVETVFFPLPTRITPQLNLDVQPRNGTKINLDVQSRNGTKINLYVQPRNGTKINLDVQPRNGTKINLKVEPRNGTHLEDNDTENDRNIQSPYSEHPRSFERSQPRFDHSSRKSSPSKSKHFKGQGGKYDHIKITDLKNSDTEFIFREEDSTSSENTDNDKDVNVQPLSASKEPLTHSATDDDIYHKQWKVFKNIRIMKSRGKTLKQTSHRKHNLQTNELKINLTEEEGSSKFGNNLKDLTISKHRLDSTTFAKTKKRIAAKKRASSSSNANSRAIKTSPSAVPYTASHQHLTVSFTDKVPMRLKPTPFKDYKNYVLSDSNDVKNDMSNNPYSAAVKGKSDHQSKSNPSILNLNTDDKTKPGLITTTHPPSSRTSTRVAIDQSKALVNIDSNVDRKTNFQEARTSLQTERSRSSGINDKLDSPKMSGHSEDTSISHKRGTEKVMASNGNMISKSHVKSNIWQKINNVRTLTEIVSAVTATNMSILEELDVTTRSSLSHASSSTTKVNESSNSRNMANSTRSPAQVLKTVLNAKANVYINAAAALDRFQSSPWKKANLLAQENSRTDNNAKKSNDVVSLKEDVTGINTYNKGSYKTQLPIWKPPKEIDIDGLENTDLKIPVIKMSNSVSKTSDMKVSHTTESAVMRSEIADKTTNVSSYSGENISKNKNSSVEQATKSTTETTSQRISGSHEMMAKKSDSAESNVNSNNKFTSSTQKEKMKVKKMNNMKSGIEEVTDKLTADMKNNIFIKEKVNHKQSKVFDNTEKEEETLAPSYHHFNTHVDISKENKLNNHTKYVNENQVTVLPVKTYKINFTSLPMLLEYETSSLYIKPDVQSHNAVEKMNNFQPYMDILDLNVASLPQKRYPLRPETPKPPSNAELQRQSIKSLKAVKFQTHAPVEWYVTAQQVMRKAAINIPEQIKQFSETASTKGILSTTTDDVEKQMEQIYISKNHVSLSDTKFHNENLQSVLQTANVNKSSIDLFNNDLKFDDTDEEQFVDQYFKIQAKNLTYNPKLTNDFNHEYKPSNLNLQQSLLDSSNKHNSFNKTEDIWLFPTESSKNNKRSNENTLKLDKLANSNLSDNKPKNKESNKQLTVDSVKKEELIERASMSYSQSSLDDNINKQKTQTNPQRTFVDFIDKRQKSNVKAHTIDSSFTEDSISNKQIYKQVPIPNSPSLGKESVHQISGHSLITNNVLNSTATTKSLISYSVNNNKESHNKADLWKPLTSLLESDNKSNILVHPSTEIIHSDADNYPQADTSSAEFDGADRNQKKDTDFVRLNLVSNEHFKENEDKHMHSSLEEVRSNRPEEQLHNNVSLFDKQKINSADNTNGHISTSIFLSGNKNNAREQMIDKKSVHNIIVPLEDMLTPSQHKSLHKLDPDHKNVERMNSVNSNKGSRERDNTTKDLKYSTSNIMFTVKNQVDLSKSMSSLQDTVKSKNKSLTTSLTGNSYIISMQPKEKSKKELPVTKPEHSQNNKQVTKNIAKGNNTMKNSQVSIDDSTKILFDESNQDVLKLTKANESKLTKKTQSNQMRDINLEPYISNIRHQSDILGHNNVLQESDQKMLKLNTTSKMYISQDTIQESYSNPDSNGNLQQFNIFPEIIKSSNISNKTEVNISKVLEVEYMPVTHKNIPTLMSPTETDYNHIITKDSTLNSTVPNKNARSVDFTETYVDTQQNDVIRDTDNYIFLGITNGLANGATTKNNRPLVSKHEKLSSPISSAKHVPPLTYDNDAALIKLEQNIPASEVDLINIDSLDSSKTINNKNSETNVSNKSSNIGTITNNKLDVRETNKGTGFDNSEKNALNKTTTPIYVHFEEDIDTTSTSILTKTKDNAAKEILSDVNHMSTNITTQTIVYKYPLSEPNPTDFTVETQILSTRNESSQDPFKMMELFISRQNILKANLQLKKQSADRSSSPQNTTNDRSASRQNTTIDRTSIPRSTTIYRTSSPRSTTVYRTSRPQNTTIYRTSSPRSTTVYRTPSPQNTTNDRTSIPRSTTIYRTSSPQNTTIYRTSSPRSTTVYRTSRPQNTTIYRTSSPRSTTVYRTSSPQNTTNDRSASRQNTTIDRTSIPRSTTIYRTSSPQNTTIYRTSSPRSTTVYRTSRSRNTKIDRTSSSQNSTIYRTSSPRSTTIDRSSSLQNTKIDRSAIPKNTTNDRSAIPKNATIDRSAIPKNTTVDRSAIPKNTTVDRSAIPKNITIDRSAIPKNTTIDRSAIPKNTTVDRSAIPKNTTIDRSFKSDYSDSGVSLKIMAVTDVGTSKSTSKQQRASPASISVTKQTPTRSIFSRSAAAKTFTQTQKMVNISLDNPTQSVSDDKHNIYNMTVAPNNETFYTNKSLANRQLIVSSAFAPTTDTNQIIKLTTQEKITTKPLTTRKGTASSTFSTPTKQHKFPVVWNTTDSSHELSLERTSVDIPTIFPSITIKHGSFGNVMETMNTYTAKLHTTVTSTQVNRIKSRSNTSPKSIILGPNFDRDGTKILYSTDKRHTDDMPILGTLYPHNVVVYPSMNTLPAHGFVLHTLSLQKEIGKPTIQSPNGLPLPKLSRSSSEVRRQYIYRDMNLDKFRSYVKAIRNHPTVKVPFQGMYTPMPDVYSVLGRGEAAELPDPVMRVGSFYTSISNVGSAFTRYWPAVLGVSIGTIFLVTALVTSILCRQRRLLIQRTRWSDSPQYVSEPPDTSEYTSSSEASLTSDLTRSSIHLM